MINLKSDLKQLGLLLWKNYKIQKRSPVGLCLELILPALFITIFPLIKSFTGKTNTINEESMFQSFRIRNDFLPYYPYYETEWYVGFSPKNNTIARKIMKNVIQRINSFNNKYYFDSQGKYFINLIIHDSSLLA